MGIYEGSWHCDIHDENYTSEGICPACYHEMQYGDARMADKETWELANDAIDAFGEAMQ